MIENGDKVEYTGINPDWVNKKGKAISDSYSLENTGTMRFVDVEWFFETPRKDIGFKKEQRGHVVNVENLRKLNG